MGLFSPSATSSALGGASALLLLLSPPHPTVADVDPSPVRINQVGYLAAADKVGVIVDSATSPLTFRVVDVNTNADVLTGNTVVYGLDGASQDHVHHADFSTLTSLGDYKLVIDTIGQESVAFAVSAALYPSLPHEAMNYFYFHRMGTDGVDDPYLIDDRYARAALHPDDDNIPIYQNWCGGCSNFDVLGSWADAGDFGIYSVNHAISAWTLLNLLEMFPDTAFPDNTLTIPESGNSIPDVLDEAHYGSQFMKGMLPSVTTQLASHKVHNHDWSSFVITISGENANPRSVMGPSTAATYAVARNSAHLARMWNAHGVDASHAAIATELWNVAVDAWTRAETLPSTPYSGPDANGGGDYPDSNLGDDAYAAAVEMYLTAFALGQPSAAYRSVMTSSTFHKTMGQWDWAAVDGAATLSLYAAVSNGAAHDLSSGDVADIGSAIVGFADEIILALDTEGYPANSNFPVYAPNYPWGSNSFMMNRAIVLAYAYEITLDVKYQKGVLRTMDYMMGVNAMRISYVTGYGEYTETDTHDRWAWTVGLVGNEAAFWPKGWLSGGPNSHDINDNATPTGAPAAKSYAAPQTAPQAWGSKENTINWNAPLVWVAWYVENVIGPNLGGCDGNCDPVASGQSVAMEKGTSTSITLVASDFEGGALTWSVADPAVGTLSGTAPDLTYTPPPDFIGVDSFTFFVTDDQGATSNTATVTITVRECNFFDKYGVPSSASFPPSGFTTYDYIHVSEDGPTGLSGIFDKHTVNAGPDSLWEYSIHVNVSPHYYDIRQCMTQSNLFNPGASFTLSGCQVPQLDGTYLLNEVDGDEVWVEANGAYAIVFSNDPTPPEFCITATTTSTSGPATTTTTSTTSTTTSTPTTTSTTSSTSTTTTSPPTTTTTTTTAPSTSTTSTTTTTTTTPTTTTPTTTTTTTTTGGTTTSGSCNLLTNFNLPQPHPFNAHNSGGPIQYDHVHVSSDGPDLSNVAFKRTNVQSEWNYNGFHEFGMQTTDGNPSWWNNLMGCVDSHRFHSPDPEFSLSGCGFPGMDEDYYIGGTPGMTEVWVQKSGHYAVVFSNSNTVPTEFC